MKIGFVYDTKEDYGYESGDLDFTDFVSLNTIAEIEEAIKSCGYEVEAIGNIHALKHLLCKGEDDIDLFFNIAEGIGSRNREALVPALLETFNRPYTASDAFAMALTLNKHFTNALVETIGVPVAPRHFFIKLDDQTLQKALSIGYPLVLKPNSEGGSMGLSLVNDENELRYALDKSGGKYGGGWLIEQYIPGMEITVPIIGTGTEAHALGVVATKHEDGRDVALYDSELKYTDAVINTQDFACPDEIKQRIMKYSVDVHRLFNLRDYARMDFRLTPEFEPFFLEANLMPSLCRDGSFEVCGLSHGYSYAETIGLIIESALKRPAVSTLK